MCINFAVNVAKKIHIHVATVLEAILRHILPIDLEHYEVKDALYQFLTGVLRVHP